MMIVVSQGARFLFLTVFIFLAMLGFGQSSITGIELNYKRDPRVVDPFRAVGPWASGPNFGGATAQDTVEVRAEGVDRAGRSAKINPQWIPSDPEMVTVSPSQGDDVKITVHRAGESKLKIAYQSFSMELEVHAQYVGAGKFMQFEITATPPAKPAARSVAQAPPPPSKSDVSYAAGMNLAKALEEQAVEVDVDSLIQGVKDTLSGGKTRMSGEQALVVLGDVFIDQRIVEEGLTRKAVGEKNKREGEAFLAENKKKEGVVTLPSGLQYKVIKAGEGKKPTASDSVSIRYRGTFIDGKEFDKTLDQEAPVSVPVNVVIQGWQEALQLMPVGSKWQIVVPPDLAYGEHGAGGGRAGKKGGVRPQTIGPNATLVFELELLGVEPPGDKPPIVNARAQKAALAPETLTPETIEQLKKVIQSAEETESKPEQR